MGGITIERGTKKRLRESYAVVLLVRDPDDPAKARAALDAFLVTLRTPEHWSDPTDVPPYAVGPIDTPLGSFVMFDPKDLTGAQKVSTADLLVSHLVAAGVADAVVSSPGRWRPWTMSVRRPAPALTYEMVYDWPPSCYLLAYPAPDAGHPRPIPQSWIEAGIAWMAGLGLAEAALVAFEGGVEVWVDLADLDSLALAANGHHYLLTIVGDPNTIAAGLRVNPFSGALCIGLGGADLTPDRADEAVADFASMAAPLDGLVYAVAGLDRRWAAIGRGAYVPPENQYGWTDSDGDLADRRFPFHQVHNSARWIDEIAIDATIWQILSTGHLNRIGSPPAGSRQLSADRWEVRFGTALDWWPSPDGPPIMAEARSALSELLISTDDRAYASERRDRDPGVS